VAGGGVRVGVEAAELVGGRRAVVPRRAGVAGAVASARVRAQIKTVPDTTLSCGERAQPFSQVGPTWARARMITLACFVFGLANARRDLHGVVVGDGHKGPGRGEGGLRELLEDVDVGELWAGA
jgi:hypothetical protein